MTQKTLTDLITSSITLSRLAAADKVDLLQTLTAEAARKANLPANQLQNMILEREALGSTGIGDGLAIPHATVPSLETPIVVVATLARPVDFDAIDERPVDIVCLMLSPPGQHISVLSAITRLLRDDAVIKMLRACRSPDEVRRHITERAHNA